MAQNAKTLREECRERVGEVLGRKVTASEAKDILESIRSSMSHLSRKDPQAWSSMGRDERVDAAAKEVAAQLIDRAAAKARNLRRQVVIQQRNLKELNRLAEEEDIHAYSGVAKVLQDVYRYSKGVQAEYIAQLMDTMNGIRSKWLGFVENAEDVRDFVREAFGEETGNDRAAAAFKAWETTTEAMRKRAVAAGADIGKLDYGYIPQSHDAWKVRKAAKILLGDKHGDARSAWVNFIMPKLDRSRYVDDAGNVLDDAAMRDLLDGAFEDIVTSGSPDGNIFDIDLNKARTISKTFKKFHHRVLHFASARDYLDYEAVFGNGALSGALLGHVSKVANDIAIMESLGPQPKATFEMMRFNAEQQAKNAGGGLTGSWRRLTKYTEHQGLFGANIESMWNVLTGVANKAALNFEPIASFMQGWRNLEIAGKLGKAFITSFSDIPSYFVATGFNRLPLARGARFFIAAYGKDWKDYAARAGIIADSIVSDLNRWSSDNLGEGWTSKMANATMKVSLLNAFTDATRRAFSLNMMAGLGKLIKTDWGSLDDYDLARLLNGGITEKDWAIFQAAGTDVHRGIEFLTIERLQSLDPKSLPPGVTIDDVRQAPSKLLGFIIAESEMASLSPDLVTRAETTRGLPRGTLSGECARAFFLFRSFPIAMMEKHFRRARFLAKHGTRADQLSYAAGIIVATTFFGAISLQVQNLLNGKDLQDMESREFWLNAFTKGGGLGFLGDFIANGLSENARMGAWGLSSILGPQLTTVVDAADIVNSAMGEALYDRELSTASRAIRIVRSHTPFINLWYTSTAIDRAVMNDLQEYLSPGYNRRMERRMRRSWGQGFWWQPQSALPTRAPVVATQPN